jgi:4-amino-4-deoxy-L-arabinose transferase-like glycosyltransferase
MDNVHALYVDARVTADAAATPDAVSHAGADSVRRRRVPPVLIVAAIAFATSAIFWARGSSVDSGFDPYYFGEMGRSIADGRGFEGFGNLIQRRAPLYPLVLGLVYFVFGEQDQVALLVNCLLFTGTAVVAFFIGRRVFNERTGIIAGVFCAFHPLLLRYVPSLHLESLLTFLVTLMVWFTVRFYYQRTLVNGVLIGFVAGLATLTKAVVLPYAALFVVGMLLAIRSARQRDEPATVPWSAFVAIALTMVVVIAPWTVRNYGTTGQFVPVSSGTSDAFLRGMIFSRTEFITLREPPYTVAENESNEYFGRLAADAGTVWERDDYETDQILNEEAKRVLRTEPLQVVRKFVVGLFTFWYQLTSLPNSLLALACAVGAWTLALIGYPRARREGRPVWLLLLPVLYLNIVLALLLALGRYSAPILPALLVLSAFGADTLLHRWRPDRADVR